jgi:hypothetical protein
MLRRRRCASHTTRESNIQANTLGNPLAKAVMPIVRRAASMIEQLEPRRYMYTVSGSGTFEYLDDSGGLVRVAYENLTAEFVFIDVVESDQTGTRPLPEGYVRLAEPVFDPEARGRDLFTIYIAESSHESMLAIARVPGRTTPNRPMQPFSGDVSWNAQNAQNGEIESASVGPGGVLIGGLTHGEEDSDIRPIMTHRFRGMGILGAKPNEKLTAGVIVEEGQSFGRMLIGGTIFGEVTIGGGIETFYAGGLALGNPDGESEGQVTNPDNFTVRGDMRNLIVGGNIGMSGLAEEDEPAYISGFDLNVTGSVDFIRANAVIGGSFDVHNSGSISKLRYRQRELERRSANPPPGSASFFEEFELGDDAGAGGRFHNDTFATPQLLGTFNSRDLGENSIQLSGELQYTPLVPDRVDYYGVGMMAGQTMTVRLLSPFDYIEFGLDENPFVDEDTGREFMELNVGVFDPDGRLIATDYDNNPQGELQTEGMPFSFRAERPGLYRIAVAGPGNTVFTLAGGGIIPGFTPYHLQITNVADGIKGGIGLGGISAGENIFDHAFGFFGDPDFEDFETPNGIRVRRGDLGAILTPASFVANNTNNVVVDKANLRSITASRIGKLTAAATPGTPDEPGTAASFSSGIDISVPGGSVGLIRATDAAGILWLNKADPLGRDETEIPEFDPFVGFRNAPRAVGFDYQTIDAAGTFVGNVVAERAIGTIRAGDMQTLLPSVIAANDDNIGNDGVIDLIDVERDMGVLGGGPELSTGIGGNIRYIRVGGIPFRDALFGGGEPEGTAFEPGESVNLVDDSGVQLELSPIPITRRFDPSTGETLLIGAGTLTVTTLPVRRSRGDLSGIAPGGGGSVILEVITTRGLQIESTSTISANAEIGRIVATGGGSTIANSTRNTLNPLDDRLQFTTLATNQELEIDITGSADVDVLEITFEDDADTSIEGTFTRIMNETGGELVSIRARSIGFLEAKTLGLAKSNTRAELYPTDAFDTTGGTIGDDADNVFPFNDQRYGVYVINDAIDIRSRHGMGNILVNGRIQNVVANSDGSFEPGVFEGINGPVYAVGGGQVRVGPTRSRGMRFVNIGEGILPSGTGNLSRAGLYSNTVIGTVVNQGPGSDIRGDIISEAGIDAIRLDNGSIINADIMLLTNLTDLSGTINGTAFQGSREFHGGIIIPSLDDSISDPEFELAEITLVGSGGIIGSRITGDDLGPITVTGGGFGIISTLVDVLGDGVFDTVVADGYGIRDSWFLGGASAAGFHARGDGTRLLTRQFSSSVRLSERNKVDPYFGTVPSISTDLHAYLGTSAANPSRKGMSNEGEIQNSEFSGSRDVNEVRAYAIKKSDFNFGNRVGTMVVQDAVDLLQITTGRFDHLTVGKDTYRMDINVAGPVGDVNINGNFLGVSTFRATGPNGTINNFNVGKSLFGLLTAEVDINNLVIDEHLASSGTSGPPAAAGVDVGRDLKRLVVGGDVLSTALVEIDDDLGQLIVGGDVEDGAVIRAESIGTQDIDGEVFGSIVITG